ncbi:hypothetical protein PRIPAC_90412 [Pristionchus pacificus]|nr:hypothetical protein PRIPAC_90412 [Pristionchus pacificus]
MGNLCCCKTYKLRPDSPGSLVWNLRMLTAESENKRLKEELAQLRTFADGKSARNKQLKEEVEKLRKDVEEAFRNERRRYIVQSYSTSSYRPI